MRIGPGDAMPQFMSWIVAWLPRTPGEGFDPFGIQSAKPCALLRPRRDMTHVPSGLQLSLFQKLHPSPEVLLVVLSKTLLETLRTICARRGHLHHKKDTITSPETSAFVEENFLSSVKCQHVSLKYGA